ncbi:Hypothetical_protein [Hexamita inflata]|uniref:Hypothetical_protein n=1 Tax=Hexamita inflata TaxID=28002 RepID=A0AA86RDS7_9EUKA|nr:Hypothetical protein HINF_LOCUS63393 [Hexamita inflata]CAI9975750.1 Hypothetical protein HINF_LOCUS63395 [Hexamita inflata]
MQNKYQAETDLYLWRICKPVFQHLNDVVLSISRKRFLTTLQPMFSKRKPKANEYYARAYFRLAFWYMLELLANGCSSTANICCGLPTHVRQQNCAQKYRWRYMLSQPSSQHLPSLDLRTSNLCGTQYWNGAARFIELIYINHSRRSADFAYTNT